MIIKGSIVALVTPMFEDGKIHYDALKALVDWHIESGTHGIVAVGTTGESATLNVEEHMQVVSFVVKAVAGRLPVIAGTGANATQEAIELTQAAADAGADASLLVTPYYNKPTQAGLIAHYQAIADAVALPQILYNVPGRTSCDMQPATVLALADHPNIVGLKEATGDLERMRILAAELPSSFVLYSGDDATAMQAMLHGAKGNISVTANVAPKQMAELCNAAISGDQSVAVARSRTLAALNEALFVESNPIPVKWALWRMGLIQPGIRLPLTPLAQAHQPQLEALLSELGLIELLATSD